jgi:hypothetical protein
VLQAPPTSMALFDTPLKIHFQRGYFGLGVGAGILRTRRQSLKKSLVGRKTRLFEGGSVVDWRFKATTCQIRNASPTRAH